jgi:diguanylate cyclase (GGDEF)-like protein
MSGEEQADRINPTREKETDNKDASARGAEIAPLEHAKRVEALFDISLTLTQSSDLPELLESALVKMMHAMEIKVAGILLLDQKTKELTLRVHRGASTEFASWVESMREADGFSWHAALSGKPLLVRDVTLEAGLVGIIANNEGFRSLAAIPIMAKTEVMGLLYAASHETREFLEQDMRLFGIIANQMAMAVENAQLAAGIKENAHVDNLTGLYSRQYLIAEIDRKFAHATGSGQKALSLIKIDVDGLKAINDGLGRQVGDAILKELAKIIRLQIRGYDIAARWGGDEFMLLIPEASSEDALKIGRRISSGVKKYRPVIDGMERIVSISMGIASYPIHASDAADIVKAVDRALGVAKRAGGNKLFSATPLASSEDRASASTGPFRTL